MLTKFEKATKLWLALASGLLMVTLTVLGWTMEVALGRVGVALLGIVSVHLSAYGLYILTRFFLQIYFARKNNQRVRTIVRTPLVAAMKELYQVDGSPLLKKKCDYETFREAAYELQPRLKQTWPHLANYSRRYLKSQPTVGIEMPVYGLEIAEVKASLVSLMNQSYQVDWIVIGLNDPNNDQLRLDLHELMLQMPPKVVLIEVPEAHKRAAMAAGFRFLFEKNVDLVLNIDGDTVVDVDGVLNAVRVYVDRPHLKGQTSNVKIRNRGLNWLTEITYQRYWSANNVERAAQSWFDAVTCMSGPFMIIERAVVEEILSSPEAWEFQTFRGFRVGPGDDRRMTTECLKRGYGICYNPDIIVWTDCPEDMPRFLRQQLRWSRSGYREFFDSIPWMWGMPLWCIMDQFYLALFPLLLLGIVGSVTTRFILTTALEGLYAGVYDVLPYVLVVFGLNVIRTGYAMYVNRDWKFWLSFLYLFIHIRHLVGIKMKALFTLTESKWLGRKGM